MAMGVFLAVFAGSCGKKEAPPPPPPPNVEVVNVVQKDVPIYGEWVGSLDGLVNATIRAQVTGYLIKQNYKEGDLVKKGQVLFEIDPRTFQAALDQARATLTQAEARHTTANANLVRIRPLAQKNAVSQKDLDDAVGAEETSRASAQAAKAAMDKAQLELDFTRITSPVDGIAGIAKAQIGNLVGPGSAEELTAVSTIDPIKCYVSLSEQEYLRAGERKASKAGKVPLELILSDGTTYPHKGAIAFADREVDVRTGTIRVAALFPNPQNLLRPGMFGRVRAKMEVRTGALVVPQRAVSDVQGKNLVAVVGAGNKITIKPVKVGEAYGQLRVIHEGLQTGEQVVAEGIQKVRDGLVVNPKPFGEGVPAQPEAAAKAEAHPQPEPKKR
jgi:membrane fusion protein (multidrug efflux system)